MSHKILALIELDDDGTLTITAGPEVKGHLTPSWAKKPEREITIEPERLNDPIIIHERERGAPNARGPVSTSLLVNRLRKLTEPARAAVKAELRKISRGGEG